MREAQRGLQHAHQRAARAALLRFVALGELLLGDLDVPVAVLVPDEAVDRAGDVVEAVLGEALLDFGLGALQRADDPAGPTVESSTGAYSSSPQSLPSVFISTKRVAFHSLLQKLR